MITFPLKLDEELNEAFKEAAYQARKSKRQFLIDLIKEGVKPYVATDK